MEKRLQFLFHKQLENKNGQLHFDGASTLELVESFDTPLYVISENRIRENYKRLQNLMGRLYKKTRVYYAAKANSNLSILRILESEGAFMDVVSPGEVFLALQSGFQPERILFTGTSVRNDELKFLADSDIVINIDSLSQLKRLLKIIVPEVLSVRVNPFASSESNISGTELYVFELASYITESTQVLFKESSKTAVRVSLSESTSVAHPSASTPEISYSFEAYSSQPNNRTNESTSNVKKI